ncbi:Protein of unknown function [Anaplasma phagocytophilum]|uniref:Uncharacterized protein n=1 Tax=Anaplasma phagocytophilum TaxID=948 RepID=A0A098EGT9_ANAPH|nr:Protein of unknown function [Anaplasma phagocytophilum]
MDARSAAMSEEIEEMLLLKAIGV